MGLALGASGMVLFLKTTFALGRPTVGPPVDPTTLPPLVRPIYVYEVRPGGYAFPSGHAMAATVTWGALATTVGVGRRTTRLGAFCAIAAAVAVSRVVLGAHFLADVVAGVALGVAFLVLTMRAVDGTEADPVTGTLALGLVFGTAALVTTGFSDDSQIVVGTALAALAVARASVPETAWPASPLGAGYAAVGLGWFGAILAVSDLLEVPGGDLLTMFGAVGAVLAWPIATARIERSLVGAADSGAVQRND
jgi:hypothetical protein